MSVVRQLKALSCPVSRVFRQSRVVTAISNRDYASQSIEPLGKIPNRMPEWMTADEAVQIITSGMRVFVHGCAATPTRLTQAMVKRGREKNLQDIEIVHIHTEGPAAYNDDEFEGVFRSNSLFIGGNCRNAVNTGRGDCVPVFLGEIPGLFRKGYLPLDVALVSVSPPDRHGYCSLGTSVDTARAATQVAKNLIGLVNKNMPRTFGDGQVHVSQFDALVEGNDPLHTLELKAPSAEEMAIGKHIAENLVVDGATLQMGIGSIPNAVLVQLKGHQHLGVHSEMFSDGVIDLIEGGNITNAYKKVYPGLLVGSFCMGSTKLFDYMHDNPFIAMLDLGFVNNEAVIQQNPKVTAINACIEMDLTGQVVSDSIGARMYSGFGGQVDFIRASSLCHDGLGKPIIALTSTTNKGYSKIVPFIKEGAGVVTSRAHLHYVVTEYGIASLHGKNFRQRAHELIRIAHPDHRQSLEKAAFERLKVMPSL